MNSRLGLRCERCRKRFRDRGWLAPDRVAKLSTPPEVRPNSAGTVEVVTLNSCRASTEGAVWSNDEPLSARAVLAPSRMTSLPKFCPPPSFASNTPLLLSLLPGPVVPGVRNTKASGARKTPLACLDASGSSIILALVHDSPDIGGFRLQCGSIGRDCKGFRDGTRLKRDVERRGRIDLNEKALLFRGLKAWSRNSQYCKRRLAYRESDTHPWRWKWFGKQRLK